MWMRRWLAERGYEVKLVENITDINDKIYEAAARQKMGSAELAEQAAQWYIDDTDELGLGRPDVEPRATEVIPEIVALIGELIDRGLAYESGGDVYFRVPAYPEYGSLSGAQPDDMIAQEPSDLKEDPRDFALWKATKAHEDTEWDSPWGPGRPGLAHRVLGDGGEAPRPRVRDPRRRPRPPLPAPRERARPVARSGEAVRALLGAQRDAAALRGEDVEVGRQHRLAAGGARHLRAARRSSSSSSAATTGARSTTRTRRWRRAECAGRELPQRFPPGRVRRGRPWLGVPSSKRSTTTSTRPRRLRSCTTGGRRAGWICSLAHSPSSAWKASPSRRRRRRGRRARRPVARRRASGAGVRGGRPAAGGGRSSWVAGAGHARRLRPRRRFDPRGRLRAPARPRGDQGRAQADPRALCDRARARLRAVAPRRDRSSRPRRARREAERAGREPRPPGRRRLLRAVQVRGRLRARRGRAAAASPASTR